MLEKSSVADFRVGMFVAVLRVGGRRLRVNGRLGLRRTVALGECRGHLGFRGFNGFNWLRFLKEDLGGIRLSVGFK